jgi:hypothetical protein
MIAGVTGGCVCGITAWLAIASQFEGGLSTESFVNNTGRVTLHLFGTSCASRRVATGAFLIVFCAVFRG